MWPSLKNKLNTIAWRHNLKNILQTNNKLLLRIDIIHTGNIVDSIQQNFVVTLSRFCLLFWCFHCCTFEQVNSGWGMTLQNIVIISHLESLVLTLHKFGLCIVCSLRLYLLLVLHPGSFSVDFEQVNVGWKGRRITIYYEIFR